MEIDKNGYIYRLAMYFDESVYPPDNFCSLCRKLILNTILIMFLCVISGVFIGDLTGSIIAWIVTGTVFFTFSTVILTAVLGFIGIMSIFVLYVEYGNKVETIKFINTYVESKKQKYCPTVTIK